MSETASSAVQGIPVSEALYRLLVERVADYAIFVLDTDGRVASWNLGAERIKGYSAGEIIGRHFSVFYPPEDAEAGKCDAALTTAASAGRYEHDGWRVRKSGEHFWANVVLTALRDEGGELVGFAKVTRDLTERRRAEDERVRLVAEQKARETADASNRAKDEFIAHVSHELRTPLNAISGWAKLLRSGLDAERAARATATIERNADAMAKLIDDLLDVSRIITGKMYLETEQVDLALVAERALESVRLAAEASGLRLQLRVDLSLGPVLGDPARLQQVAWNLLTNAVKFTPRGGHIVVSLREDGGYVVLSVQDSGRGISKDQLDAVFDPFWQEAVGPTSGTKGLGLGLAIVRNIIELHGGRVEVSSEGAGHGATFTVWLPMLAKKTRGGDTPLDPPAAAVIRHVPSRLAGLNVLLVEDDADGRELVCSLLEGWGCKVVCAPDARSAFRSFQESSPDVLLSDVGLPDEDGYSLIRRIRSLETVRGGHVPAIAITAYASAADRSKALSAGFVAHLPKPIDPNELLMTVGVLANVVAEGKD